MNKNFDVVRVLEENQYKYPALPPAVPNLKRIVIDIPTVNEFSKDTLKYYFNIKSPLNTKVRYIVVYGADHISRINTNDATQIIDKIMVHEIDGTISFSIPAEKMNQYKACAVTFIDYFANESTPTTIDTKKTFKIYTPAQPNENR